jgi:hypothetical protein
MHRPFCAAERQWGIAGFEDPDCLFVEFRSAAGSRHGMILDASYVGNVAHHGFGNTYDANAIAPLTT